MTAPQPSDTPNTDLTPKDKTWWVECVASFIEEDIDDGHSSSELTARIDDAFEKGQSYIREVLSQGQSEANESMNSMLKTISERLERIEQRLDSSS